MPELLAKRAINDELEAWLVRDLRRSKQPWLRLQPLSPARYFKGRTHIELTSRELEDIVLFVKANST